MSYKIEDFMQYVPENFGEEKRQRIATQLVTMYTKHATAIYNARTAAKEFVAESRDTLKELIESAKDEEQLHSVHMFLEHVFPALLAETLMEVSLAVLDETPKCESLSAHELLEHSLSIRSVERARESARTSLVELLTRLYIQQRGHAGSC